MLTEEETQAMVKNGTTAFIDPRYLERSFAESKLVEIIPQCWIYDPRQRIDIFQLVDFLHIAVNENKMIRRDWMIHTHAGEHLSQNYSLETFLDH